jgi:signal transduction histidine kinase
LELHVETEPRELMLDGSRIERVLNNLVRNAIEHTPPGGTIAVSIGVDGDRASVRVFDTGDGIPEADIPHVWDRFYRVDKARTRDLGNGDGGGLGLAIVRSIVEAHEGTVAVRSARGRGAEFEILLPAAPDRGD